MPLNTVACSFYITPVVIKTASSHLIRRASKKSLRDDKQEEEARDSIFFDEAFHIVKAFIELATKNTVESLQAFTNTHVPSPYYATVVPLQIPFSSCNEAADLLISWFSSSEIDRVVGGERWWQVRGLDGVDAEWITMSRFLRSDVDTTKDGRELSDRDRHIKQMDHLQHVMLYIHGGAFAWGSINTHRYQLIRYARKIGGRVFAPNYRKSPQYPFPCPLQDVLSAYLYLIRPPPSAIHTAVKPSNIVLAGDSAGGNLCLSLLTLIRDLSLPMPAGAALISPWVDLTHSFPSVMDNTATDIIPPYGFIHKPSAVWPIPAVTDGNGSTEPNSPTDILKKTTSEEIPKDVRANTDATRSPSPTAPHATAEDATRDPTVIVKMEDPKAEPMKLRAQIQLYATNQQVTHPLVSPLLQGSLGGLCPLYILAGESEVLRDEVTYLAHRAAYPERYPVRKELMHATERQLENTEKYNGKPTRVHLQVYDDMCHVLTVFTFTQSAKYAYRAISEFTKRVIDEPEEVIDGNPFPEISRPASPASETVASSSGSSTRSSSRQSGSPVVTEDVAEASGKQLLRMNMTITAAQKDGDSPAVHVHDSEVRMIRQRVAIDGLARELEPPESIPAMQIPIDEIGIIKQAPAERWLMGQNKWDNKFKLTAERVVRQRRRYERKTETYLERAKRHGLDDPNVGLENEAHQSTPPQDARRWGPLDLDKEHPPPSAIAARCDTPDALSLIKKSIHFAPPASQPVIPQRTKSDVIRGLFSKTDEPTSPPKQSPAEQQNKAEVLPVHGLKMWSGLMRYFVDQSSHKTSEKKKKAKRKLPHHHHHQRQPSNT